MEPSVAEIVQLSFRKCYLHRGTRLVLEDAGNYVPYTK